MMDIAFALALKCGTTPYMPVRRNLWITRMEDHTRDTSLPEYLAAFAYDEAATTAPPLATSQANPADTTGQRDGTDLFLALDQLAKLGPGWDGDRAIAPAPLAISNAALAALQIEARGLNQMITGDVDGGIIITLPHPTIAGRFAALSCDNEGEIYLILEAPPEPPRVRQVEDAEGLGPATLDEIAHFLSH